jgi:hypothetical protein
MSATTDQQTIREFLALPAEALPGADWLDPGDADEGSPYRHLRDAIRPESAQQLNHVGQRVRLHADRDGWRDGVIVTV